MYGTWISASCKPFSKVFVDAHRPHHFRESVRNRMINDTPMENSENLCRRVRHPTVIWPGIHRVVDHAIYDTNGHGRGGRGRSVGEGSEHRERYERPGAPGPSGPVRDHPRVSTYSGPPDDILFNECSPYPLTGHLEPQYWPEYSHLRPDHQPIRVRTHTFQPRVGCNPFPRRLAAWRTGPRWVLEGLRNCPLLLRSILGLEIWERVRAGPMWPGVPLEVILRGAYCDPSVMHAGIPMKNGESWLSVRAAVVPHPAE